MVTSQDGRPTSGAAGWRAGPVASIYDFVMPPRQAASAEPAVKPAMRRRPAGRTPPAPPATCPSNPQGAGEPPSTVEGAMLLMEMVCARQTIGSVPHHTGRQLGAGASAPTAAGQAPMVSPAGQAAGSMPQPGTVRHLIYLAKGASEQLLGSSNAGITTLQIPSSISKPYSLHVSDQADVGMDCGLNRATEVVPVLCVPGSSWPNPPQPPPPFLIRRVANEWCDVLWVDPHQPRSAVARGWEKVMWALYWPNGQLVVGLPAAGSSGLLPYRPTPALMQQPTHPTQQPAPQQHNSGAEQAQVTQLVAGGAPGPPAPHPSCPGLPGGPAPLPAQQACPGSTQSSHVSLGRTMCWAKHEQEKLLLSPGVLHGHQHSVSIEYSQYLLKFMAQPALQQPGKRDEHRQAVQAMLCVTHDGQPTLQQLPPPMLFTRRGDSELRLFWKDPCGTWSSLMQHWEEVKWIVTSLRGQWVLGLKAAGSAEPAGVSLGSQLNHAAPAAAPPLPPYPQQQSVGVQQASMARQPAPAALEPPSLPAAAPALPSGPEPHLGPAACPAHDLAAMRAEVVGLSARPGTQFVATPWRAASVLATAWPDADPQPHIDSWTQLKGFNDRTLEYLPKPLALQFRLDESGADKVELLVVLEHPSGSTGADQGPGCLQLPYEATRGPNGRWSLKARHPQSMRIPTWVKSRSFALTGRCKAQCAEQGQAKERLLVLEVRPLNEAAASVGHATPGVPAGALGTSGAGGRLFVADAMSPPIQTVESGAVLPSTLGAAGPAAHPAPPLCNMGSQGQQQPCAQQGAAHGHVAAGVTKTTTPPGGASYPLCDRQPEPELGAVSDEEGGLGPGFRTGMKRKAADADADADQSPEAGQAAAAASVKRHLGCGSHELDLVAGVPQPASDQGPEEMEMAPAALPVASAPADTPQGSGAMLPAPESEAPSLPCQPNEHAAGMRCATSTCESALNMNLVVTVGAMLDEHLPASELPMFKEAYKRMEEWLNSPHGAAQLVELRKAYIWNLLKYLGRTSRTSAWNLWESIQRILGQTPTTTSSSNAGQARGTRDEPIELSDDTGDEADADHGQAPVAPDGAGPASAPGPAAAPGNLAAAAVVATAGPGVDPLPHVPEWS